MTQTNCYSQGQHMKNWEGRCVFCGELVGLTETEQRWNKWYASIPKDLTKKLSLDDLKRIGDCFKGAFNVG